MAPLNKSYVQADFNNRATKALVDTGAGISCISQSFFNSIPIKFRSNLADPTHKYAAGVGGELLKVKGMSLVEFKIQGQTFKQNFHVFPHIHHHLILGDDFLTANQAIIDKRTQQLHLGDGKQSVAYTSMTTQTGIARLSKPTTLPPASETLVPVTISRSKGMQLALLEPTSGTKYSRNFMIANSVVQVSKGLAVCRILNPTPDPIQLSTRHCLALATPISENSLTPLESTNDPSVASLSTSNKPPETLSDPEAIRIASSLGIKLDNPDLSENEKNQILALIGKNRDIFATDLSELGTTNIHTHKIDTGDATPVRKRPYRTSPKIQREIDKQIDEMLDNGIIEESFSLWQSPVVMVKKKSGEYRFAVDYRAVNKCTRQISFPLPRLESVFDTLGEAKAQWFTTLDLASGFWQIPLDPETKEKTTFVTNNSRQFNFWVLPFGLVNAPSTYQHVMTQVLHGLNWKILLCYIDNIIIFSKSLEEHLEHKAETIQMHLRSPKSPISTLLSLKRWHTC